MILLILNSAVFVVLGFIHFYWAFGGKKWLHTALPTDPDPAVDLNFKPGFFATTIVAIGLCFFGFLLAAYAMKFQIPLLGSYLEYALYVIAAIFLVRATGDFKYAGFFKTVKGTVFSKMDTKLFSPLCMWLGLSILLTVIFL